MDLLHAIHSLALFGLVAAVKAAAAAAAAAAVTTAAVTTAAVTAAAATAAAATAAVTAAAAATATTTGKIKKNGQFIPMEVSKPTLYIYIYILFRFICVNLSNKLFLVEL